MTDEIPRSDVSALSDGLGLLGDEWQDEHWGEACAQSLFPALTHYTSAVQQAERERWERFTRATTAKELALREPMMTYTVNQPNNANARTLGEACRMAAEAPGGDYIDQGLQLLRELESRGFGVVKLKPNV